MIYVGIDNGVTGSIGIVGEAINPMIFKTPVTLGFDFQKSGKQINRLDWDELDKLFQAWGKTISRVAIERPLINPKLFSATISAVRSFESWILYLEKRAKVGYTVIDSRKWQKKYLPAVSGKDLKKASLELAFREDPNLIIDSKQITDADAYWIARYIQSESGI